MTKENGFPEGLPTRCGGSGKQKKSCCPFLLRSKGQQSAYDRKREKLRSLFAKQEGPFFSAKQKKI